MIFVDTNVFMYAVGRAHPLRDEARDYFRAARTSGLALATSAEVLQELLHAYLPVQRVATLDSALRLATSVDSIWPLEPADVDHARVLVTRHPELGARDLIHLASCQRRQATGLKTFDRALEAAWRR